MSLIILKSTYIKKFLGDYLWFEFKDKAVVAVWALEHKKLDNIIWR